MSTEELDPTVSAEQAVDASWPRVRLQHLFVFIAVAAVLLATNGQQTYTYNADPRMEVPRGFLVVQHGFSIVNQLLFAVAVTALGYGLAGYRRGRPFFNQPGHWMLLEASLLAALMIPMSLAIRFSGYKPNSDPFEFPGPVMIFVGIYSMLVFVLGRIALNVYLAVARSPESRWRNVFIAKALEPVTCGVGDIAVIVLALMANATDRKEQIARDAFHRCGLYVQIGVCVATLLGGVVGIAMAASMMARVM